MKLKDVTRVDVENMHGAVWPAMMKLDQAWRGSVGYELIITSAKDGRHSATSRHYLGTAVDVRTWTAYTSGVQMTGTRRKDAYNLVKTVLGDDWFVLDEKSHFHLDYRPRYKGD